MTFSPFYFILVLVTITVINREGRIVMATLKYSRQRESIKEFLMTRTDHPTADTVYHQLRKIYRTSVSEPSTVTWRCWQISERFRKLYRRWC